MKSLNFRGIVIFTCIYAPLAFALTLIPGVGAPGLSFHGSWGSAFLLLLLGGFVAAVITGLFNGVLSKIIALVFGANKQKVIDHPATYVLRETAGYIWIPCVFAVFEKLWPSHYTMTNMLGWFLMFTAWGVSSALAELIEKNRK